jgi:hypothetical protein
MSDSDGPNPIILFSAGWPSRYDPGANVNRFRRPSPMNLSSTDRVIHVPLSEADWKAFLASQPQPVDFLREKIKEAIEAARQRQAQS